MRAGARLVYSCMTLLIFFSTINTCYCQRNFNKCRSVYVNQLTMFGVLQSIFRELLIVALCLVWYNQFLNRFEYTDVLLSESFIFLPDWFWLKMQFDSMIKGFLFCILTIFNVSLFYKTYRFNNFFTGINFVRCVHILLRFPRCLV